MGVFWVPDVYNPSTNAINDWVNSIYLLGFRLAATGMVLLAILPMILDLKDSYEHVPLLAIIQIHKDRIPKILFLELVFQLPFPDLLTLFFLHL